MTRQLKVWKFILANLQQQIPVALLYVVKSSGSSPGRQGFFMAVNAKWIMIGSIGGGIMEHKFVELAKDKLRNAAADSHPGIRKQVHDKSAERNQSGMICSGEQDVLLYLVQQADLAPVQLLVDSLHKQEKGTLLLDPSGIHFINQLPAQHFSFIQQREDDWRYEEMTGYQDRIHIIGGGHCGLALSRLMKTLDFYVHVYDERIQLNTMLQNDAAHQKTIVESYDDLSNIIPSDENDFVVVMTFGYRTDDIALRALINKKFRYLGVLGSKKKIEKMFADYRSDGWTETQLASLHAPIGINIKSETPEEIAISIAAEIIKVKNNADKNR